MQTVSLLDQALGGPGLIFGSLPPDGRDLDLLLRAPQLAEARAALEAAGFRPAGSEWVRFGSGPPEIVELVDAGIWGLSAAEIQHLYEQALPLPGIQRIARPAPQHALLIAARRTMRSTRLQHKVRLKVDSALREDPRAWERARERASAWGCSKPLSLLERQYRGGPPPSRLERGRAVRSERRRRGQGRARSVVGATLTVMGRPRFGAVIAISGLDGSGKSTQARRLAESLELLGKPTALEWPAIDAPSWAMRQFTRLAKGIVRAASTNSTSEDPARALRRRSGRITFVWSSLHACRGGVRVARLTWPHVLGGRTVICDRYLLDTIVFLNHGYGYDRRYRFQLALVKMLSPAAKTTFLLEVSPETASMRQPERTVAENAERATLYRRGAEQLGAVVLDGERSADEIAAELAEWTWQSLA